MRMAVALVLLAAAFWQAALDWRSTIGEGYAYRLSSVDQVLAGTWPEGWGRIVESAKSAGLWDPLGATITAMPLALMMAGLAAIVWIARRRKRSR